MQSHGTAGNNEQDWGGRGEGQQPEAYGMASLSHGRFKAEQDNVGRGPRKEESEEKDAGTP